MRVARPKRIAIHAEMRGIGEKVEKADEWRWRPQEKDNEGAKRATVASAREEAADFIYEIKIVLKSVLYKHVAPFRWCAGRLL